MLWLKLEFAAVTIASGDIAAPIQPAPTEHATLAKARRWQKIVVKVVIDGMEFVKPTSTSRNAPSFATFIIEEWAGLAETGFSSHIALLNACNSED